MKKGATVIIGGALTISALIFFATAEDKFTPSEKQSTEDVTLSFDTKGWTQEEINFIQAAVNFQLYQQGITYSDLDCVDNECSIKDASANPNITGQDVLDLKEAQDEADAADRLAHPDQYR